MLFLPPQAANLKLKTVQSYVETILSSDQISHEANRCQHEGETIFILVSRGLDIVVQQYFPPFNQWQKLLLLSKGSLILNQCLKFQISHFPKMQVFGHAPLSVLSPVLETDV